MTDTTLTGAGLIASAYPARYYAQYDRTAAGITPVTALIDTLADATVVNALPAAADMVALTTDQWALAQTALSLHVRMERCCIRTGIMRSMMRPLPSRPRSYLGRICGSGLT